MKSTLEYKRIETKRWQGMTGNVVFLAFIKDWLAMYDLLKEIFNETHDPKIENKIRELIGDEDED